MQKNPTIKMTPLSELHPYANNPRNNDAAVDAVALSIQTFGFLSPIVARENGEILAGHTRYRAALKLALDRVPVLYAADLDDAKAKAYRLADNKVAELAEWDLKKLKIELDELDDFNMEDFGFNLDELTPERPDTGEAGSLEKRFIVPPFTILDSRQGRWLERKRMWNEKINDHGESREGTLSSSSMMTGINNGVSIFDPVLAEIICKWFGIEGGKAFDTFAGDSAFGRIANHYGMEFTGIELREGQAELNNKRVEGLPSKYICDDGRNVCAHLPEVSQDLFFSCPPYYDLEVYSDKPNDASNQATYEDFLAIIRTAFTGAVTRLKKDRFAVVVCGDIRDRKGFYRDFPGDIKRIFEDAGAHLYNELILVEAVGTLCQRVGRTMRNRKVGKCHQNVLVFFNGDPDTIKQTYKEIEYTEEELESFTSEE